MKSLALGITHGSLHITGISNKLTGISYQECISVPVCHEWWLFGCFKSVIEVLLRSKIIVKLVFILNGVRNGLHRPWIPRGGQSITCWAVLYSPARRQRKHADGQHSWAVHCWLSTLYETRVRCHFEGTREGDRGSPVSSCDLICNGCKFATIGRVSWQML